MAARGTFGLRDPDSAEMTLTITMSVKEWKIVQQRLNKSSSDAEWYLDDTIGQMIDKAGKHFSFYVDNTVTESDKHKVEERS